MCCLWVEGHFSQWLSITKVSYNYRLNYGPHLLSLSYFIRGQGYVNVGFHSDMLLFCLTDGTSLWLCVSLFVRSSNKGKEMGHLPLAWIKWNGIWCTLNGIRPRVL